MCKPGDIIVINSYKSENCSLLSKHSFVVISSEKGDIKGLAFDLVASVMSSFRDNDQKVKKLRYEENFHVTVDNYDNIIGNDKEGYIKADQLYFFDKTKIDYLNIGTMEKEVFDLLLELIELLDQKNKLKNVLSNLFVD